jgi:hypothetical protein
MQGRIDSTMTNFCNERERDEEREMIEGHPGKHVRWDPMRIWWIGVSMEDGGVLSSEKSPGKKPRSQAVKCLCTGRAFRNNQEVASKFEQRSSKLFRSGFLFQRQR